MFTYDFVFDGNNPYHYTCDGEVTISTQDGGSFSGSYIIRSCAGSSSIERGQVVDGKVSPDGTVQFDTKPTYSSETQCTVEQATDPLVRGRIQNNRMQASQVAERINCAGFRAKATVTVDGTKK